MNPTAHVTVQYDMLARLFLSLFSIIMLVLLLLTSLFSTIIFYRTAYVTVHYSHVDSNCSCHCLVKSYCNGLTVHLTVQYVMLLRLIMPLFSEVMHVQNCMSPLFGTFKYSKLVKKHYCHNFR